MNDFLEVLAKLELEIRDAKRTVLGGNRYIDDAKCMDYIFVLKNLIPNEIKESNLLLAEREEIIINAKADAEEILNNAYEEMNRILDESEIINRAKHEAQIIVANAEKYVGGIKIDTVNTINSLMNDAENNIIHLLNAIRDSKDDLSKLGIDTNIR